jgi:hypothetical protein
MMLPYLAWVESHCANLTWTKPHQLAFLTVQLSLLISEMNMNINLFVLYLYWQ